MGRKNMTQKKLLENMCQSRKLNDDKFNKQCLEDFYSNLPNNEYKLLSKIKSNFTDIHIDILLSLVDYIGYGETIPYGKNLDDVVYYEKFLEPNMSTVIQNIYSDGIIQFLSTSDNFEFAITYLDLLKGRMYASPEDFMDSLLIRTEFNSTHPSATLEETLTNLIEKSGDNTIYLYYHEIMSGIHMDKLLSFGNKVKLIKCHMYRDDKMKIEVPISYRRKIYYSLMIESSESFPILKELLLNESMNDILLIFNPEESFTKELFHKLENSPIDEKYLLFILLYFSVETKYIYDKMKKDIHWKNCIGVTKLLLSEENSDLFILFYKYAKNSNKNGTVALDQFFLNMIKETNINISDILFKEGQFRKNLLKMIDEPIINELISLCDLKNDRNAANVFLSNIVFTNPEQVNSLLRICHTNLKSYTSWSWNITFNNFETVLSFMKEIKNTTPIIDYYSTINNILQNRIYGNLVHGRVLTVSEYFQIFNELTSGFKLESNGNYYRIYGSNNCPIILDINDLFGTTPFIEHDEYYHRYEKEFQLSEEFIKDRDIYLNLVKEFIREDILRLKQNKTLRGSKTKYNKLGEVFESLRLTSKEVSSIMLPLLVELISSNKKAYMNFYLDLRNILNLLDIESMLELYKSSTDKDYANHYFKYYFNKLILNNKYDFMSIELLRTVLSKDKIENPVKTLDPKTDGILFCLINNKKLPVEYYKEFWEDYIHTNMKDPIPTKTFIDSYKIGSIALFNDLLKFYRDNKDSIQLRAISFNIEGIEGCLELIRISNKDGSMTYDIAISTKNSKYYTSNMILTNLLKETEGCPEEIINIRLV